VAKWGLGLHYTEGQLVERPLQWQRAGLQQTATGYGSKLTTSRMLQHGGRLCRVYCYCYSNSGTCYVIIKGDRRPLQNWVDRDGFRK
jgi:hypothetical protein